MNNTVIHIVPSILSADFARLGEQVTEVQAAGADRIQIDVMDGHFVPNITVGPLVVEAVRRVTTLPLEAHLMIQQPERYVAAFIKAGADIVIVHQEASPHLHRTISHIKELGKQAGVAINPATPVAVLDDVLGSLDLVLVMTVNPGFGGQTFIRSTLPKIRQLRAAITQRKFTCDLEVDGGINEKTAPLVVEAGANVLVAGSAIFGHKAGIAAAIQHLGEAARKLEQRSA